MNGISGLIHHCPVVLHRLVGNIDKDLYTLDLTVGIDQIITKLVRIARLDANLEKLAIKIAHKSDNHILGKPPDGLAVAYVSGCHKLSI